MKLAYQLACFCLFTCSLPVASEDVTVATEAQTNAKGETSAQAVTDAINNQTVVDLLQTTELVVAVNVTSQLLEVSQSFLSSINAETTQPQQHNIRNESTQLQQGGVPTEATQLRQDGEQTSATQSQQGDIQNGTTPSQLGNVTIATNQSTEAFEKDQVTSGLPIDGQVTKDALTKSAESSNVTRIDDIKVHHPENSTQTQADSTTPRDLQEVNSNSSVSQVLQEVEQVTKHDTNVSVSSIIADRKQSIGYTTSATVFRPNVTRGVVKSGRLNVTQIMIQITETKIPDVTTTITPLEELLPIKKYDELNEKQLDNVVTIEFDTSKAKEKIDNQFLIDFDEKLRKLLANSVNDVLARQTKLTASSKLNLSTPVTAVTAVTAAAAVTELQAVTQIVTTEKAGEKLATGTITRKPLKHIAMNVTKASSENGTETTVGTEKQGLVGVGTTEAAGKVLVLTGITEATGGNDSLATEAVVVTGGKVPIVKEATGGLVIGTTEATGEKATVIIGTTEATREKATVVVAASEVTGAAEKSDVTGDKASVIDGTAIVTGGKALVAVDVTAVTDRQKDSLVNNTTILGAATESIIPSSAHSQGDVAAQPTALSPTVIQLANSDNSLLEHATQLDLILSITSSPQPSGSGNRRRRSSLSNDDYVADDVKYVEKPVVKDDTLLVSVYLDKNGNVVPASVLIQAAKDANNTQTLPLNMMNIFEGPTASESKAVEIGVASAWQKHFPLFLTVIILVCLCLFVIVIGLVALVCLRYRLCGKPPSSEKQPIDKENGKHIPFSVENPIQDEEIVRDEAPKVESQSSVEKRRPFWRNRPPSQTNNKVKAEEEQGWIVPLDQLKPEELKETVLEYTRL